MNKLWQEAATWFLEMNDAAADHPDRKRFEAWLAADPTHAAEYAAFAEAWKEFDSVERSRKLAGAMERRQEHLRTTRRRVLKGGAMALLLAALGSEGWSYTMRHRVTDRLSVVTSTGEVRRLSLSDGSTVTLGADSGVDVAFSRAEREVRLARGEAIFDVARDAGRPFVVDSGPARIIVLGTCFAVSFLPDRIRVSVDHGTVSVESGTLWNRQRLVLRDGQVAEVVMEESDTIQWAKREVSAAFAFPRGEIVFDGANLAEIAETLSRYRGKPVRSLPGKAGGGPTITATIQVADVDKFLHFLPITAPVTVDDAGDEVMLAPRQK